MRGGRTMKPWLRFFLVDLVLSNKKEEGCCRCFFCGFMLSVSCVRVRCRLLYKESERKMIKRLEGRLRGDRIDKRGDGKTRRSRFSFRRRSSLTFARRNDAWLLSTCRARISVFTLQSERALLMASSVTRVKEKKAGEGSSALGANGIELGKKEKNQAETGLIFF